MSSLLLFEYLDFKAHLRGRIVTPTSAFTSPSLNIPLATVQEEPEAYAMADRMDVKLVASSPSNKPSSSGTANFRTEEIRGYLFKKTREGKWQKRWFETNGCFLTYYKKQGQKLLAALNLPQVGAITLLQEDHVDGPGLFTIELNERVYTIKARSHDEAAFWVDALLWRQAGGLVTQKSPDVTKQKVGNIAAVPADQLDSTAPSAGPMHVEVANKQHVNVANPDDVGKDGAPCAACCVVQ